MDPDEDVTEVNTEQKKGEEASDVICPPTFDPDMYEDD